MQTKTLSKIIVEIMNGEDIEVGGKVGLFCISLIEENQALLAKNKELEEEVGMKWNWAEMAKEIKRGIITTDKLNKQGE
jgi:hypothetical protein